MRAMVYTAPYEMQILEQPAPNPGDGESVVRVEAVGICGSDMHAYQGHDPRRIPPLVLGHEICGTVTAGPGLGRRAILNPLVTCGRCFYCGTGRTNLCTDRTMIGMNRPGGFAEALSAPEQCLVFVPDDMRAVDAALAEPAATGLHGLLLAARAMARPIAESRALVLGAGSVGLLSALALRHQGCGGVEVAERNPLRQEPARLAGFDRVYAPGTDAPAENAFDLVVDCVGGRVTREIAMHAVAPGGVVLHIGLMDNDGGLDARKSTLAEVTIIGAYTYTRVDLEAAVRMLHAGAYGSLDWVESQPMEEGPQTFQALLAGQVPAPKVVLVP